MDTSALRESLTEADTFRGIFAGDPTWRRQGRKTPKSERKAN